jgi:hypothetical protein
MTATPTAVLATMKLNNVPATVTAAKFLAMLLVICSPSK